jgi:hypothetical protein
MSHYKAIKTNQSTNCYPLSWLHGIRLCYIILRRGKNLAVISKLMVKKDFYQNWQFEYRIFEGLFQPLVVSVGLRTHAAHPRFVTIWITSCSPPMNYLAQKNYSTPTNSWPPEKSIGGGIIQSKTCNHTTLPIFKPISEQFKVKAGVNYFLVYFKN